MEFTNRTDDMHATMVCDRSLRAFVITQRICEIAAVIHYYNRDDRNERKDLEFATYLKYVIEANQEY